MPDLPWTDTTLMPWGDHKGKKIADVPHAYLLWLFSQPWIRDWEGLYLYLKANEKVLREGQVENDPKRYDEGGFNSYQDYKDHRGF